MSTTTTTTTTTPTRRVGDTTHARLRAADRHALDLTAADVERLTDLIRAGDARALLLRRDGDDGRGLYALRCPGVAGEWLPAVYDRGGDCLVTVLPSYVLRFYRRYLEIVSRRLDAGGIGGGA